MTSFGAVLDLAAELERRDRTIADTLAVVQRLDAQVEDVGRRCGEVRQRLDSAPARLAAIDQALAHATEDSRRAAVALTAADQHLAQLLARRKPSEEQRAEAEWSIQRAREAAADAARRVERLAEERRCEEAVIGAAREDERVLLRASSDLTSELSGVDRLSESGREPPGETIDELGDWSSRVHAALFVVRGQLEVERDRVVREANELGGAVLGEQLAGASVALVRRRLEEALRR